MPRRSVGALLFLLLGAALPGCGGDGGSGSKAEAPAVRLVTTTSARDTGLLDALQPDIEKKANVRLRVVAVGTGQAIALARRGDADLILVHDRPAEDAFVKDGFGTDRRDLMWNDFVVVGPAADPVGGKGGKDAAAAFKKIAEAKAKFVSRGDKSGTHTREKSLWAKAGVTPPWDGYVESGQGQGATLTVADEKAAYTLSDRGTFASMRKKLRLVVLVEGDPALVNPYGVILVDPKKFSGIEARGARAVLEWLVSPEGQAKIEAFRVDGEAIFHTGAPSR